MRIVERCLSQFHIEKRRRQRMASVLVVLSLFVAIGVSWNLRLTGITMANEAFCGQEEHQHSEKCLVEKNLICGFSDPVYNNSDDTQLVVDIDVEKVELVCALAEHEHGDTCYTEERVLVCTTTHEHEDSCYKEEKACICSVEHGHEDGCYEVVTTQVCNAEHEHGDDCFIQESNLICTQEHGHTEYCYATQSILTCALGHEHADVCYEIQRNLRCSSPEHTHADECYATEETITSETTEATEETTEHIHTDGCYEITYLCGYEEHIHKLSCYSDDTADLETAAVWETSLPTQLTSQWADDLVLVAETQIGYGESEKNYILAEDGETKLGITRYGQWYGNPYGDWSAMFLTFCLNYADVPQEAIPWSPGVYNMMRLAEDAGILTLPDTDAGSTGNILFLDTDDNGNADKALIVTAMNDGSITAVGGDWDNCVAEVYLAKDDPMIVGYINVGAVQTAISAGSDDETAPPDESFPTDGSEPTEESGPTEVSEPSEGAPNIALTMELLPEKTDMDDAEVAEAEPYVRITAQLTDIDESLFFWQWQVSADGSEPWTDIEGAEGLVYEFAATEENITLYYRLQGHKLEAAPMMLMAMSVADETDDAAEIADEVVDNTITSEAVTPFSIGKNNNIYTIDVYALPVDGDGNRIVGLDVTELNSIRVNSTTKTTVQSLFTGIKGTYQSAYFGSETTVDVDNIASVWRYQNWWTYYYLAYAQTDGTQNQRYKSNADSSISLYLRYIPEFTVSFTSDGATTLTEDVVYGNCPTLTEPGEWTREGYALVGWTISGDGSGTVYTYDQIMAMPVTADVTYTAQWRQSVTVSFNLGEYAAQLYPIEPREVSYGDTISPLPTPGWRDNSAAVAFAGWYLNQELSIPVDTAYEFYEDTILYAKWSTDEGYYVYFMDFERGEQTPLVLMTYSVTEGKTASPYTPGNAPAGTQWDKKWYLDSSCTTEYNFAIPVSNMTDYLTGANSRDLYLYPGTQDTCRAIFVTYGTRIDPVSLPTGGTLDLDYYIPERDGYEFAGWALADGTPVSGVQTLTETTTYYAIWSAGYVPFEAILRIENANDTGMTQADVLGTWYAKPGSQIRVNSTYTGTGTNRRGTHEVVCVLDGEEYPVYTDAALTRRATLNDVYSTYFVYNNTGTTWTDEVNWDDIYTGGELPYSPRPISSAGDTIINFDYMRVRKDIVFTIPNNSRTGGYIDIYKLCQNSLITGALTYTGTTPTGVGQNVSATGVSSSNVRWTYTAAANSSGNNLYTLHSMKYGQRIYEVYPVGGSWLTARGEAYHQYKVGSGELFSSRRQDLTADFYSSSGRALTPYSLTAEFGNQDFIALMYAVECLAGETADFTLNGVGYKVQTQLCEVVKHTGTFGIKSLAGCADGKSAKTSGNTDYYTNLNNSTATVGGTSVKTLFGTTYWDYYKNYSGISSVSDFDKAYVFYYDRLHMGIQFNFAYDSDGDGANETVSYENIAYGESIAEYRYGMPDNGQHPLLSREGYEFAGWLDANGFVLEEEDWASMVATGDSEHSNMIFIAKWEKISNNIVEYYEDVSAAAPFESHYFDDGAFLEYPTMTVYPDGWVWQEGGEGAKQRFDWDVPLYGEYGVQEVRKIDGEEVTVNVIRIYGVWDESHTKVVYDPNPAQGGIPGTAPTDDNEYTIWQSEVSVQSQGGTANTDPEMVFAGWQLDRNGVVYHPGDHVPVQWPRTMIFTAQWAKAEDVVYLRYDPNGGSPDPLYPSEEGFAYKSGSSAAVWNNTATDGTIWYIRPGYSFAGWNTKPDGSGTAYAAGSTIVLTEPITTLYAQWESVLHTLSLHKVDSENGTPLTGAMFALYKDVNGTFVLATDTMTTGTDGHIVFSALETNVLYKLVEEKPPDGYAILAKEVYFKLLPNASSVSLVFCDSAGNAASAPRGVTGEYIAGNRLLTLKVGNLRGYALPSTGGIGIPLYILCGLALVLAPIVYTFSLRRKYERRSKQ